MKQSPLNEKDNSGQRTEKKQIPVREGYFHQAASSSDADYLIGSKCNKCGYVSFPRRPICPACVKEETMEEIPLSTTGKIYSYSVLHVSMPGFKAPYIIARTELPEGSKVTSPITGCEPVEGAIDIGTEVELVIGKISEDKEGNEIIGYMFRPIGDSNQGKDAK